MDTLNSKHVSMYMSCLAWPKKNSTFEFVLFKRNCHGVTKSRCLIKIFCDVSEQFYCCSFSELLLFWISRYVTSYSKRNHSKNVYVCMKKKLHYHHKYKSCFKLLGIKTKRLWPHKITWTSPAQNFKQMLVVHFFAQFESIFSTI